MVPVALLLGCGEATNDVATESSAIDTVASPVRGYTRSDSVHALVFRKPGSSHVFELTGAPGSMRTLTDMGGVAGGAPWGYRRSDNADVVMYVANDGHIHEMGRSGASFVDYDWTALPWLSAPPAANTSIDAIGYVGWDNRNVVAYRDQNNHVIEVISNFSGSPAWIVNDITAQIGTPIAAGNVFPFGRYNGQLSIVYISATDSHIHEVVRDPNGSIYTDADLFAISGETVVPFSDVWAFRHDGMNDLFYVGSDQRLHRLSTSASGCFTAWCTSVILSATVRPAAGKRPSAYQKSDAKTAVVYVGTDGKLHEVSYGGLSPWTDVTIAALGMSTPVSEPFAHRSPSPISNSVLLQVSAPGVGFAGMELSAEKPSVFAPVGPYAGETF